MGVPEELMGMVVDRTNCREIFTYPGSPPRYLYEAVLEDPAVELSQVVREQHLLHLAQNRYYRRMEDGATEIPVVIVSGEMGEGMLFQPLIAGSISAPCLVIVAESVFPHVGSSFAIAHQTDRATTAEDLDGDADRLMAHENVVDRVRVGSSEDVSRVTELITRIWDDRGVGIVHLPEYVYNPVDGLDAVLDHTPAQRSVSDVCTAWAESDRPLFLVGRGAKHPDHRRRIERHARRSGAPIAVTMPMEGYFDVNYVGRVGVMGDEAANTAVGRSDCVVALGTSLHTLVTSFDPDHIRRFQSKTYQVEINERRHSVFAKACVHADLADVLDRLDTDHGPPWFETDIETTAVEDVPSILLELGDLLRNEYPDRVVNIGVGNSSIWLPYALGPEIKKSTSRSGSMGELVGALARESDPILVIGDGEFEMDLSILTEAQYMGESATLFVVNNARLGLVTERQEREFGDVLTPKREPIDYDDLATGFVNVTSDSVCSPAEVKPAARRALESDTISILELEVTERLSTDLFDPFELPGLTS